MFLHFSISLPAKVVDLWNRSGDCDVWTCLGLPLSLSTLSPCSHHMLRLLLPAYGGPNSVHHLQRKGDDFCIKCLAFSSIASADICNKRRVFSAWQCRRTLPVWTQTRSGLLPLTWWSETDFEFNSSYQLTPSSLGTMTSTAWLLSSRTGRQARPGTLWSSAVLETSSTRTGSSARFLFLRFVLL